MIEDWINKKNLSKMGYTYNYHDLTEFEVSCYNLISNRFSELEADEMKRNSTR